MSVSECSEWKATGRLGDSDQLRVQNIQTLEMAPPALGSEGLGHKTAIFLNSCELDGRTRGEKAQYRDTSQCPLNLI